MNAATSLAKKHNETRLKQIRSRLERILRLGSTKLGHPIKSWTRINVDKVSRRIAAKVALDIGRKFNDSRNEVINPAIQVLDCFCGAGGMSIGFRAANAVAPIYELLGGIDVDEDSLRSFRSNVGSPALKTDIRELASSRRKTDELLQLIGRDEDLPLVLIGCAPCQGFSSHRNGARDKRNSLFLDFLKLAKRLHADAIIIENVPELLTGRHWRYASLAREQLERSGFYVHVAYHNMAAFGVPQDRFRALLIAMRKPFAAPTPFLESKQYRTVKDAIGSLRPVRPGRADIMDPLHYCVTHKNSTVETIKSVPTDGGSLPLGYGPPCLMRAFKKNGKKAYEDVYGRLAWRRPAITITAHARNPASGRFSHPSQHRGLTVREAALLQSFPTECMFAGSLDSQFRQIGNAVPPAFSAYLAVHLAFELSQDIDHHVSFSRGVISSLGSSFSRIIPSLKMGALRNGTNV